MKNCPHLNTGSLPARLLILALLLTPAIFAEAEDPRAMEDLKQFEQDRTDAYAQQLEGYLQRWLVEEYPQRTAKAWNRDYSSVEAFLRSVEPNRGRWQKVIKP